MEEYKSVVNYQGHYEVSNLGNIRSLKNGRTKTLKQSIDSEGYSVVGLSLNGLTKTRVVHQLVAESFLNHNTKERRLVVNHVNFNKRDNRVENLTLITQRENSNKRHLKTSSKYVGVSWAKGSKRWVASITINGKQEYLGMYKEEGKAHDAYQKRLSEIK